MGNDYEQRKHSKKRRRTDIDSELASEGGSKHKKKRAAIRRICKGMCYNQPQLTVEDKQWEGDASDEEDAPVRERRLAQAAITELNRDKEEQKAKKEAAKAKRTRKRLANGHRMSTAVALIEPRGEAAEAAEQPQLGEAERDALGEAMRQFPDSMQRYMLEEGLAEPMPIQQRCWPLCLEGRDLMATAEPGSGKTLGYLLPAVPLLQRLGHSSESQPDGPVALILVPTRELAQQVATVMRTLRKLFGLRTLAIIGGADKDAQVQGLSKKPHIVVATPGRLLDLLEEGHFSLDSVCYVVLDEADKMLGLGLQPQLEKLRKLLLPLKRQAGQQLPGPIRAQPSVWKTRPQVVMVSATSTEEAEMVAAKWMRRAVRVHSGMTAANISRTVVQTVHVCAEHKKPQKLLKHLQQIKEKGGAARNLPRVLIFANHIKTVRFLHQTVGAAGFRTAMLHGERSQPEREEAMRDFRSGKAQVLVATDVAARGLHIRGLPFVINYDLPGNLEAYIHRAGRTGRLASDGHCYSFFTRNLAPLAAPLLALLQEHDQAVDPNLLQLAEAYRIAAEKLQAPASGDGQDREASTVAGRYAGGSCAGEAVEDMELLADLFGGGAPSAEKAASPEAAEDAAKDHGAANEACQPGDALARPENREVMQNEPRTEPAVVAGRKRKRQALPGRLRKKLASDRNAKTRKAAS